MPGQQREPSWCEPGNRATLWLGANPRITAIVAGALAVVLGGDVFWLLIALLLGQLIGGAVMASLSNARPA